MLNSKEDVKLAVKMIRQDMERRAYRTLGDAFDSYNYIWFDGQLTFSDFEKVEFEYEKQLVREAGNNEN